MSFEAKVRAYWDACYSLHRGSNISTQTACLCLASLARQEEHNRLRCAAGGALASLGLSGVELLDITGAPSSYEALPSDVEPA